jgi:hypothetical protein
LGEQQPESDHFIESKDSGTGYMEDRHFRDAKGWFSYQMKNNGKMLHTFTCCILMPITAVR